MSEGFEGCLCHWTLVVMKVYVYVDYQLPAGPASLQCSGLSPQSLINTAQTVSMRLLPFLSILPSLPHSLPPSLCLFPLLVIFLTPLIRSLFSVFVCESRVTASDDTEVRFNIPFSSTALTQIMCLCLLLVVLVKRTEGYSGHSVSVRLVYNLLVLYGSCQ